jgi:hypothetical protein
MKIKTLDNYASASILLLAGAGILIATGLVTNLGEFITAAFVISGTVCALAGIFILSFTRGETIDPRYLGILAAQWGKNMCSIEAGLHISGKAHFLPSRLTGEPRVMQFNPTMTYTGGNISAKEPFTKIETPGLIITPCCDPWIQDLRKRNGMVIPHKKEELIILINEILGDVFGFASRVSGNWRETNAVELTFHKYRFIDGCKAMPDNSGKCCAMNPCPVCCLCGALIAEGTDTVVTLEKCSIQPSSHDFSVIFSLLPSSGVSSPSSTSTKR